MTKDYFRSRKCILFWTGKPGGCVSSGSVESRLTWPLFGHLDTCLNSIVARGAKGCALWCFLQWLSLLGMDSKANGYR